MTPAQIRSFYVRPSSGGSNVIAIVDAFHYPTSLNDFNVFAQYFGLPMESSTNPLLSTNQVFQVVYATGSQPAASGGWSQEMALDIEWAHALAPSAKIVLVEAASNSYSDLLNAVDVASGLSGVKEVSMSWGGNEFSGEVSLDSHFPQANGIIYFASSGDSGGVVIYPSASADVVAVGGTSVKTDSHGNFVAETGWSGSGGGTSAWESKPSYQNGVAHTPASGRGIPDIASDADPSTGVSVYDSTAYDGVSGWMVFGGTSVSSPCVAALANLSGTVYMGTSAALTGIYGRLGTFSVRDITSGTAGANSCQIGWDAVTGVGALLGVIDITGNVTLRYFGGDVRQVPVTIKIKNLSGVVLETDTVILDSSGNYSFNPTAAAGPGLFTAAAKASHWLAQAVSLALDSHSVGTATFSLKNGDINGDNVVEDQDYSLMGKAWYTSAGDQNYNINADLNGDGFVEDQDYSIMGLSWYQSGDAF
jgi:hypothetical protein